MNGTDEIMSKHWIRISLPTLLAFALSVAALSTASASDGPAPAPAQGASHGPAADQLDDGAGASAIVGQEGDGDANGDGEGDANGKGDANGNGDANGDAAIDAPPGCVEVLSALHPSLVTLCRVFQLVPPQAQASILSVIEARADQVAPGFACRRLANADAEDIDPELAERCRFHIGEGGRTDGASVCRRLHESDDAAEHRSLLLRCRNFVDGERVSGNNPIVICRRLANSDEGGEHPALAERCRTLLDEGETDAATLCDRLLESDAIEEHRQLAKRCSDLAGDADGVGDRLRATTRSSSAAAWRAPTREPSTRRWRSAAAHCWMRA